MTGAPKHFSAPVTLRLNDIDAERVRLEHNQKIRELQNYVDSKPQGAYLGRQLFTASGVWTPNPLTRVWAFALCGGGGPGGNAHATGGTVSMAAGGGSAVTIFGHGSSSTVPTGGAVTIGAAGAVSGAAGGTGSNGGSSTAIINGFTHTAAGGGAGAGASNSGAVNVAGAGFPLAGSTAVGFVNQADLRCAVDAAKGDPGLLGVCFSTAGGGTGYSGYGGSGALGIAGTGNAGAAGGYGGGGAGATAVSGDVSGGAASGGVFFVDEWSG